MSNLSLCWWLPDSVVAKIDADASKIQPEISKDDKYVTLVKQLTADADTYYPKSSTGWRGTDIDIVQSPQTDPRVVNQIAARMQPSGSAGGIDTSEMSNAEIAANVIPQGLDFADVHNFVNQTIANQDDLKQAIKDADAAAAKAGDEAAAASAAAAQAQPIVTEPPKTE